LPLNNTKGWGKKMVMEKHGTQKKKGTKKLGKLTNKNIP
jgi:hypothetical protein